MARIVDGDTVDIAGTRIRLQGIDAPEAAQTCDTADGRPWDCGGDATRVMTAIVGGRPLECHGADLDKYGRLLATCYAGGIDISAELVERGYAWAFVRYSTAYVELEAHARAARLGIWQGAAQPAWEYRAAVRAHAAEMTAQAIRVHNGVPFGPAAMGGQPRFAAPKVAASPSSPAMPAACAIKGNVSRSGLVYHLPSSPWYDKVSMAIEKGKRWFCTEAEAIAAGWRPALVR